MVKNIARLLELSGKRDSCSKCTLLGRKFVPAFYPKVSPKNIIMVVGEAPGYEEVNQGEPFVGKSGQLLRECLKEVGFTVDELVFSNVCKCHPDNNETPTTDEINYCVPHYLEREIELIKPQLIIAVGSVAFKGLRLGDKITESRGQVVYLPNDIAVFPTYHPSYILRNYAFISVFKSDLRKAYNLLFVESSFKEDKCLIVTNSDDLKSFDSFYLDCKSNKSVVSIDIETNNMLNPLEVGSSLVCVGISDGDKSFCVVINHPDIVDLKYRNDSIESLKKFMSDKDIGKIGHNLIFDYKWLVSRGIEVNRILGDTMVMAHIIDENRKERDYGLKVLVMEYFGCYKHHMDLESINELGLYNCEDVYYTKKLYDIFWNKMDLGQRGLLRDVISKGIPVLAQMELEGIQIDLEYCVELSRTLVLEQQDRVVELDSLGFKGVNLNSNDQLAKVIFDDFQEIPTKVTKTGKRSVDEETIVYFANERNKEWAKVILEYRRTEKMLTTYIDKFYELADSNSRVRGQFHMIGTVTGRLSSSKPNLQNISKDSRVLRMFTATQNYKFFYFDFSQIELCIAASVANERTMIKMYKDGKDIHRFTASKILNKPESEVTKDDRQKAKAVNFGFLYGAAAETFQRTAKADYGVNIPITQCERFRKTFFETFSDLSSWYELVKSEVKRTGCIRYPTGRIRHLGIGGSYEDKTGDIFRQAVNSPIQGGASDIVVYSMGELYSIIRKRKLPARFILTVHDSVLLECWDREDVMEELRGCLDLIMNDVLPNKFTWLKVPMRVDVNIGSDWSKLK